MFLPYGKHSIDDDDVAAVAAVLRSEYLTTGPAVPAFEAALATRTGGREAVACASGTAALHLAALGLELGPDDVVIVPAITFMATANGPALAGARVVFADVDPTTGLLGPDELEEALSRARARGRPRAVFAVHLNGQCAPMASLADVAKRHGIAVVEDAAHAIGGAVNDDDGNPVPVGACRWSDLTVFSFHPVKTITMGEGGAITLNDGEMAERLRRLRNHGITRDPAAFRDQDRATAPNGQVNFWYHEMQALGLNYRASDIHCALGRSQLAKLDRFVTRRRELVALYETALEALAPTVRPVRRLPDQRPAWHLMAVLVDFVGAEVDRNTVMTRLRERGIGTQVHYIPVPLQPYWDKRVDTPELPGASAYYERVLSLPLFAAMGEADVERVVAALSWAITAG